MGETWDNFSPLTREKVDNAPDVTPGDVADPEEALLKELAGLSRLDYDKRRIRDAKALGVRVGTLDAEVGKWRTKQEQETPEEPLVPAAAAPWEGEVDGAQLLNDLATWYGRYVVLPNGAADVLALWTEHTYAVDAAQITPRLAIVSPQPRCGKTTLMALLGMGVCRPLQSSNISTAGLFRAIEQWQPTLLIDEGDTFLKDNEEFRGVLNAGHFRPNAYVVRAVPSGDSWVAQKFGIWGPVAIALIGRLPSTLGDRSITIRLRRKTPLEQVQRLRLDKPGNVEELRQRCRRWAQDHLSALTACDPSVPEMVNDRAADNWRCLCSIAEVAGGEWPERVQKAMKLLAIDDTDDDAVSAMLLADIREIFAEKRVEKISSDELTTALHGLEERPWSEWGRQGKPITTRQLAGLLRPFDIRSRNVKVSARSPKGYHSDDFTDAWSRYLSPIPPSSQEGDLSATPLPASNGTGVQPFSSATHSDVRSATPLPCNNGKENCVSHPLPANTDTAVADQNTFIPASILDGSAVADRTQISVADENALRPASILDGSAVADKSPGKEEGG